MSEFLTTLRRKARLLVSGRASVHRGTEPDADDDPRQALRRETGTGQGDEHGGGRTPTTAAGNTGGYVGQVSGEDDMTGGAAGREDNPW
ncbi:MAG: hypothetical protein J2P24_01950 [Streptosporangiales bacterium]|nr:hypothetical protein [Streptosporangiales bacterium]MBO0889272.1 hypothetical protein [Acidothermales bacterium]